MERKWVGAVTFLVLVSGWFCSCCCGCWDEERNALLELKNSMYPLKENALKSWGGHGDCCEWVGIKCNITTKRVIQLFLNQSRDLESVGWYLNSSMFLPFEDLKSIFLRENGISGFMENEGLEKLSSLRNLEVLDLGYNGLDSSSIFSSIGRLSSLKYLNLSMNWITGEVSGGGTDGLSRLNKLEFLDLSINQLDNSILSSLAGLSSLKTLNLANNELEGSLYIPGTNGVKRLLMRLNNLEELDLSSNSFGNNVFSSLRGLPSLKILDLRNNKLKGMLDITELLSLNRLEELDLSENEIEIFLAPKDKRTLSRLKVLELTRNNNTCGSCLLRSMGAFSSIKTLDLSTSKSKEPFTAEDFHIFKELEVLLLDASPLHNDFLQSIGTLGSLKALSLSYCELNGTLPKQGWCELKNLEELDLSRNNLQGILPSCLGNLSYLQVLDISSNHFIGNISTGPLTNVESLEYLSFSDNNIQFPASFSVFANHSRLKVLLADNNRAIPESLPQTPVKFQLRFLSLPNVTLNELPYFLNLQNDLRVVDLSHNNITGGFPSWLFLNNTRLEVLNLGYNFISGPLQLPSQPHSNIVILDVSNNRLQSNAPLNLGSIFPHLRGLVLSENSFEGHIPASFGNMKFLESLSLSNNNFSGSIPDSLGGLSSLAYLDISDNLLSGGIPKKLVLGCPLLNVLKLSNNNLQGQVFPPLFNLTKLSVLHLGGNEFTGEIPEFSSIGLFSPAVIDMSDNYFSGKLPRWIGNISSLNGLSLSKNDFRGPFPEEFCTLDILDFLDLSENNLAGSIPECFNPVQIRHVHLSRNRLTGPLTKALYGSSSLETLDLRGNNLTGPVPGWIGSLPSLSTLLLKANIFGGDVPIQLCKLNNLRVLDLSENRLSGPIPLCLSNLTFETPDSSMLVTSGAGNSPLMYSLSDIRGTKLAKNFGDFSTYTFKIIDVEEWMEFTTKSMSYIYSGSILDIMSGIDLSSNLLTGRIPPEVGYLNAIRALNLSHNYFSGSIPSTFSNLKQIESLDLSYNNLIGRIPPQLTELNALAVFSVAYNNLSGPTPDRKAQFGTFTERSYEGNLLLCGPPLQSSCFKTNESSEVPASISNSDTENGGLIDMSFFYWSFAVTFMTMLMGIAAVLYINPYWRRAWFYWIEVWIDSCYYFVLDNLCCFSKKVK